MASKNISIVLFLTINLVFFGFTTAQAPAPEPPVCPTDSLQVQACVNALNLVTLTVGVLTTQMVKPCCELLVAASVPTPVATVCICDGVKAKVGNALIVDLKITRILQLCGMPPEDRVICP